MPNELKFDKKEEQSVSGKYNVQGEIDKHFLHTQADQKKSKIIFAIIFAFVLGFVLGAVLL